MEQSKPWGEYYERQADREPRPQLAQAIGRLQQDRLSLDHKSALEIGAGNMIETRAMLEAGFGHVLATDMTDGAEEAAASLALDVNDFGADVERLEFIKLRNEELADQLLPESQDLVAAYYSLPFTHPAEFPRLWVALTAALKPGGVLSVTLFGDHDDWALAKLADGQPRYPKMTFHTRSYTEAMLANWDNVQIHEREYDGKTTDGMPKHWHVYDVLATKPHVNRTTPDNQV